MLILHPNYLFIKCKRRQKKKSDKLEGKYLQSLGKIGLATIGWC